MSDESRPRLSKYVQDVVVLHLHHLTRCVAVFLSRLRVFSEIRRRTASTLHPILYGHYVDHPSIGYDPRRPHRVPDFRTPSVFVNTELERLSARRHQYNELLHRVPDVPWLAILDWVLHPPLGDRDVNVVIQDAKAAERTRLAVRRVCRAWKAHADATRCFVDVAELVVRGRPLELARKARVVSCRQKPDGHGPDARTLLEAMEAILSDYTQIEVIRLFTYVCSCGTSVISSGADPPPTGKYRRRRTRGSTWC